MKMIWITRINIIFSVNGNPLSGISTGLNVSSEEPLKPIFRVTISGPPSFDGMTHSGLILLPFHCNQPF